MGAGQSGHISEESFFAANQELVKAAIAADKNLIPALTEELLTGFMTISDLTETLHGADVNYVRDFDEDYVVEVLLVDCNHIINSLRKFGGSDRRGILKAKELMTEASNFFYKAQNALHNKNLDDVAPALNHCRDQLDAAYGQLQHWEEIAEKVRQKRSGAPPPVAPAPPDGDPSASDSNTEQTPPSS